MKFFRIFTIIFSIQLLFFISCFRDINDSYYIYSEAGAQVITVLTSGQNRYIIDGKVTQIPESDFILVNLPPSSKFGDELIICFSGKEKGWRCINNGVTVVENRLAENHVFLAEYNLDEKGIPTLKADFEAGCVAFSLERGTLYQPKAINFERANVMY